MVGGFALLTVWCGSARPVLPAVGWTFHPARSSLFTLKGRLAAKRLFISCCFECRGFESPEGGATLFAHSFLYF